MRARVESIEVEYKDHLGEIHKGVFKQDPWSDDELVAIGVDLNRANAVRGILRSRLSDRAAHQALHLLYLENAKSDSDNTRFHVIDSLARLRFLSGMLDNAPVAEIEGEEAPVFFDTDGSIRLKS
ncbi:MAG: hypothetical protein JWO07_326 [Candidatus Saccharibacteria bacterium]|nr:hypothetical protein [Candidatus Saccharibacteria bacterium]